jgi:hypothetical protein
MAEGKRNSMAAARRATRVQSISHRIAYAVVGMDAHRHERPAELSFATHDTRRVACLASVARGNDARALQPHS